MAEIVCKRCESPDCKGCNIFRLAQMLERGKLDGLMNENRAIQTNADVCPVVRGRWRRYSPLVDTFECDQCGYQVIDESFRTNFCPNCGADMREVQDG